MGFHPSTETNASELEYAKNAIFLNVDSSYLVAAKSRKQLSPRLIIIDKLKACFKTDSNKLTRSGKFKGSPKWNDSKFISVL